MSKKDVAAIVSAMGVFTSIISLLVEFVKELGGTMESIYRLATPDGRESLKEMAQVIVDGVKKSQKKFLKLVSGNEMLIIGATDGKEIIVSANDLFTAGIDDCFRAWHADETDMPTEDTAVAVYELIDDGEFSEIFGSLPLDVGKLCLTQSQIIGFVKKYRHWLYCKTFFLFRSNGNFFVAIVHLRSDSDICVRVRKFGDCDTWFSRYKRHFVVPQV
jgi:hypothetical protein